MKKEKNIEEKIADFRDVCIKRYNALYLENDYKKGNRLEGKIIQQAQELIISEQGINAILALLNDENEIVRYYSASIVFSLYPREAKKTLKEIEKHGQTHLASNVKYVIQNYEQGNNFFQKFLKEREN